MLQSIGTIVPDRQVAEDAWEVPFCCHLALPFLYDGPLPVGCVVGASGVHVILKRLESMPDGEDLGDLELVQACHHVIVVEVGRKGGLVDELPCNAMMSAESVEVHGASGHRPRWVVEVTRTTMTVTTWVVVRLLRLWVIWSVRSPTKNSLANASILCVTRDWCGSS